jgi:hypothetical protein
MFATGPVFAANVDAQGRKLQVMTFSGKCCRNAQRGPHTETLESEHRARSDGAAGETWNLCLMRAHAPMKLVYARPAYHSRDRALAGLRFSQRVVA